MHDAADRPRTLRSMPPFSLVQAQLFALRKREGVPMNFFMFVAWLIVAGLLTSLRLPEFAIAAAVLAGVCLQRAAMNPARKGDA